ncbi:hypothetical protein EDB87DRAFT_1674293 [Lactarius vividus]|nr:hypothetical protein EDB87DRAFT_1674293 [Lactarius vividus]
MSTANNTATETKAAAAAPETQTHHHGGIIGKVENVFHNTFEVVPSKRVCIVGAGANGLTTLKVLAETRQVQSGQWSMVAFEERDNVGCIWHPAPPSDDPPLTPLYDSLRTNLPHLLMAYRSFPFPPETALFPTASVVQKYLENYAAHFGLLLCVRLCTRVERAFWDRDAKEWEVTLSTGERLAFDFVVVANGHTRKPQYPATPRLQHWLELWWWAVDPAQSTFARMDGVGPLLVHSIPGPTYKGVIPFSEDTASYRKVDRVREYQDDGTVLGAPAVPPPLPNELYNSTNHVFPLAYELFPLRGEFSPTSIAFTGLPCRVSPIPIFEDQAQAIVRVLGDPESLDSLSCAADVMERAHRLINQEGVEDPLSFARAWIRVGTLGPFKYRAELNAFAGKDWTAPDWEIEFWTKMDVLRREWKEVEQSGKSEEWLKGVGSNGVDDWVGLCKRLINRSVR